jgi:two-component system nitrogen regulation response regulator NtrX
MQQLREQVQRIAQSESWVLITGEPGSGKETFARYIHACSARNTGTFIELGAASIARENSAIELFGSEEEGKIHFGRLEQANGGILFLGNVADMDLETQGRLLSALETRTFLRVGGTKSVQVDVRIIAVTSRDLEQEIREGRFREDLYYHLNVLPLHLPPLREHCEDVPELLNFYVNRFVEQENLPYRRFSVGAQNRLRNYTWPGNLRELKNLVQRLLILGSGPEIETAEVDQALGTGERAERITPSMPIGYDLPLREAREQFEKEYLEYQLRQEGGSVGRVAKVAGMERTHLYRKLRALGIDPKRERRKLGKE